MFLKQYLQHEEEQRYRIVASNVNKDIQSTLVPALQINPFFIKNQFYNVKVSLITRNYQIGLFVSSFLFKKSRIICGQCFHQIVIAHADQVMKGVESIPILLVYIDLIIFIDAQHLQKRHVLALPQLLENINYRGKLEHLLLFNYLVLFFTVRRVGT